LKGSTLSYVFGLEDYEAEKSPQAGGDRGPRKVAQGRDDEEQLTADLTPSQLLIGTRAPGGRS
jgi:hypothetical protein